MAKWKKEDVFISGFDDEGDYNEKPAEIYTKIPDNFFKKGTWYMRTFHLDKFLSECDYNALTMKLLCTLTSRIDFNNRIKTFRQVELAEKHKTSQANISRSLKKLVSDGIIEVKEHDYYFSQKFIGSMGVGKKQI